MSKTLTGKVALVTGGSRGIGAAIVRGRTTRSRASSRTSRGPKRVS